MKMAPTRLLLSVLFLVLITLAQSQSPHERLFKAVVKNDAEIINATLVEHRDVLDANLTYKGEPVIMRAVEKGYYDATQALLQHGASLDSKNKRGQDILYVAADKAFVAVAQLILSRRNNLLPPKVDGYSAFHRALMGTTKKHTWTVEMFLQHGISPYDQTGNGVDPIELAATEKSRELVKDKINLLEYFGASARGEL